MSTRPVLRVIQGGRSGDALPARWRAVADQVVRCGEALSGCLAAGQWSRVVRLVEERRILLRDLRRAALDPAGRRCVRALEAAIEESEAMVVYLAAQRMRRRPAQV
jgi:ABC-type thiamine transport system ATPase subunit